MIEFPSHSNLEEANPDPRNYITKGISSKEYEKMFAKRRLPYLPIINSRQIADGIFSRINLQLRNRNVEHQVQCPPGDRAVITDWPSLTPSVFQRIGPSSLHQPRMMFPALHQVLMNTGQALQSLGLQPAGNRKRMLKRARRPSQALCRTLRIHLPERRRSK